MSKDLTPTVTVDLLKCAEDLTNINDNLIMFKPSLIPLKNPLEQFFKDLPRSSIHLTIGREKFIIKYDTEKEKTIAKDSLGNEISYDAVLQKNLMTDADKLKNDYENFKRCLKAVGADKITEQQIKHIANNFHQATIALQGYNLVDHQSLRTKGKTVSSSYHDTLHINFGAAGQMELNLRAVILSAEAKKGKKNIAGYSEYRGVVDESGKLLSSTTSIQGDESSFLFKQLKKYCTFGKKTPSIKTKIVEHIINTGKEIEPKSLGLNLDTRKPIPDYQGKTIAEEILINKMVHSLDQNFNKLKGKKLTEEDKETVKHGVKETIEPFSKIPELSGLTEKLDVDAIVRRSAREYKGLKQGFKSKMRKYFRKIIDLFKRNKKIEGIVKTSDVVKALKKYVSTQNPSNNVNKKTSGEAVTR